METNYNIYRPPIDVWLKIHHLVEIVKNLASRDEESDNIHFQMKENEKLKQEVNDLLFDEGINMWLAGIDSLKKKGAIQK